MLSLDALEAVETMENVSSEEQLLVWSPAAGLGERSNF